MVSLATNPLGTQSVGHSNIQRPAFCQESLFLHLQEQGALEDPWITRPWITRPFHFSFGFCGVFAHLQADAPCENEPVTPFVFPT